MRPLIDPARKRFVCVQEISGSVRVGGRLLRWCAFFAVDALDGFGALRFPLGSRGRGRAGRSIVAELLAFGRRNPETAPSPTAAVPEPAGPGARTDSELTS
jgi:hypothetical protein